MILKAHGENKSTKLSVQDFKKRHLYEDDFKLCGAVQLMLSVRKKKSSVGVNPLLPE